MEATQINFNYIFMSYSKCRLKGSVSHAAVCREAKDLRAEMQEFNAMHVIQPFAGLGSSLDCFSSLQSFLTLEKLEK